MADPDPQAQLPLDPPPTDPSPPPPPDPAALLAQEREARARAEGEAAALRAQLAAPPPPAPEPAPLTPAVIQGAFERGEITDVQRIQALADLQAQARVTAAESARRLEDARTRAGQGLAEYVTAFPELGQPDSVLLRRVAAELEEMRRDEGADPRDLRTQLRAVKSVCGALTKKAPRDFQRERIPVGGSPFVGGGPGGTDGGGTPQNKLAHVPPAQLAHWKRLGYSQAEMEAEAPYVKVRTPT